MTIKLTDIQLVLLTAGAQRYDGSLLPPPKSLAGEWHAITGAKFGDVRTDRAPVAGGQRHDRRARQ